MPRTPESTDPLAAEILSEISDAIHLCRNTSRSDSHTAIAIILLSILLNDASLWRLLKSVRFCPFAHNYHDLSFTILFGGDMVYGNTKRLGGVWFRHSGSSRYRLMYSVFGHVISSTTSAVQLGQILVLKGTELDHGRTTVVEKFGHHRIRFSQSFSGHMHTVLMRRTDLSHPAVFELDPFCSNVSTVSISLLVVLQLHFCSVDCIFLYNTELKCLWQKSNHRVLTSLTTKNIFHFKSFNIIFQRCPSLTILGSLYIYVGNRRRWKAIM